jgi:uncharacterized coiled-coil protein SlyX
MSEERLSRIESKLDQLAEAISSIARVEEKIYASSHRIDRLEFRLDKQEEALINLKTAVEKNSDISKTSERLFWIVITTLVSSLVYFFKI